MTFGELKEKRVYLVADTISFVDTNGAEMDIDNLDDEVLLDTYVAGTHYKNGHLEIMLN